MSQIKRESKLTSQNCILIGFLRTQSLLSKRCLRRKVGNFWHRFCNISTTFTVKDNRTGHSVLQVFFRG